MNKSIISFFILILSIAAIGCNKAVEDIKKATPKAVVCVIAIDGSGSYEFLDKAKLTAVNVVNRLPDNSKVFIRWITDESTSDKAAIVSAVIPEAKKPKNPYDFKGKNAYRVSMTKKVAVVRQISSIINDAKSPMANKTDIYGALYAASERFGNNTDRHQLILLTDMDDNVGRKDAYTIGFKGADVKILDYQVSAQKEEGKKEKWSEFFRKAGAGEIEFRHIDDPITTGGL